MTINSTFHQIYHKFNISSTLSELLIGLEEVLQAKAFLTSIHLIKSGFAT